MQFFSPAIEFLNQHNIPYSVVVHPEGLETLDDIAAFRGQRISQIVRSLLFRHSEKSFFLVLAQAGYQVDWKILRDILQVRRVTTATPDEVFRVTGYVIGAVSPFGLVQQIPIFVSKKILQEETISVGSGIPRVALILRVEHFLQALEQYNLVDI